MKRICRALLLVAGVVCVQHCDLLSDEPQAGYRSSSKMIVATTSAADFSAGNVGTFSLVDSIAASDLLSISSDNSVKIYNGAVYILERWGKDNIIKFNSGAISSGTVVKQEHIGDAVNLHDIAFVSSTKAYVTQYDAEELAVYNPSTGAKSTAAISLSAFAPAGSSTPNMDQTAVYRDNVYVGLQKLSNDLMTVIGSGSIAVVNFEKDSVEGEILLGADNPQGMYLFGSTLYVACTGAYGARDGGIVSVDLQSETANGTQVDEVVLGGDVSDVLIVSDTLGFALVADSSLVNKLVPFNPGDKTVGQPVEQADAPACLAFDGEHLYIASRSLTNPGIVILDPATGSKISGPHDVGLPPNSLGIYQQ
ncbi:MAG: hypothetical protein GF398_16100 [Chitinivibrionales bacterium]|nr:hypothetical protein [Chitinivibrionales bacterium]